MAHGLGLSTGATARALLAGGTGSAAVIAAVIVAQRVVLPIAALKLGESDRVIAIVALAAAAALGLLRARASDTLGAAVRRNYLDLYLAALARGPLHALPSGEAVSARLATALPVLVAWAVDGVAVVLASIVAVPAVTLLIARALGPSVLVPLAAAGLMGAAATVVLARKVEGAWTTSWDRARALLEAAGAAFDGAADLRAHGRVEAHATVLREHARAWSASEGRARALSTLSTWGALGATLLAWIAATKVTGNSAFEGRDAYKSSLLVLAAVPTLQTLINGVSNVLYAKDELLTAEKLSSERERERGRDHGRDDVDPTARITLDDVSFTYPGAAAPAIDRLSLAIDRGESVAIVGPNGAGKTTLLHLLLGIARPDRGAVTFGDRAIGEGGRFRDKLAYVSQRPFELPAGSIADNLRALDPGPSDKKLREALAAVGLWPALVASGVTEAEALARPYSALSRGQMRRVVLARALLRDADLLVLDEPEAHLDDAGVAEMGALLARLAQDRRVIAVVHDKAAAGFASRVIELGPPRNDTGS